jgi:phytoene dehydrogenase-like protein
VERPWEEIRNEVGEQIIDSISEYAPDFRERLLDWTVQSPIDIQTRVGMTDGNIRHLDMIPSQLLSQRQPYRTHIGNFYMCGSGTHPMGEVTGAPGHNAAHAILRDLERVPQG